MAGAKPEIVDIGLVNMSLLVTRLLDPRLYGWLRRELVLLMLDVRPCGLFDGMPIG